MRKKLVGILFFMLFITTTFSPIVMAGDEENPEIIDTHGEVRTYLDIDKVWFYEDSNTPEILYTTIKLTKISTIPFKQHLVVSWEMNSQYYSSMLAIGYSLLQWLQYFSINGRGQFGDPEPIISIIQGSIDLKNGTITCIIPKSTIGNPVPGDILTNTKSECFQRFGFWGRLGFSPFLRDFFFNDIIEKWQLWDIAPDLVDNKLVYGKDYVIQY